jgi:hypothetical protein
MIPNLPRRLPTALWCALLFAPATAFAAAAPDAGAVRAAMPVLAPSAVPLPPLLAAPALRADAPTLLSAPSAGFLPAFSAASAPDLESAAVPAAAASAATAAPAPAPAIAAPSPGVSAAAPRPDALVRARTGLRSAAAKIRSVAIVAVAALTPTKAPALPIEMFLRENQNYAAAANRASLADGSVVEASARKAPRSPYLVGLAHPGIRDLIARVEAAKARGLGEDGALAEIRAAVRAALRRQPDSMLKAAELDAARARKSVPLGLYLERGRGTSEEAALLYNLLLQRAGFKPKLVRVSAWRRDGDAIVDEERTLNLIHTSAGQTAFDPGFDAFDGAKFSELAAPRGEPGRSAGIAAEFDGPRVFTPAGKPKTSGVEAKVSGAKELTFAVTGRSAADRLFKEDEQAYQAAALDQPVTVEWLFFPFYMDGHTALRVGDKVYEFRRKGWRTSPARAFLFNNPFFDTQIARHPHLEMPPFSFGTPLSVRKSEVSAFIAKVGAMEDAGRGWFSFWFNNCNQVPFRFLKKAGVALIGGFYTRFSSVRSYRTLLLHPPVQAQPSRIYPLPSQNGAGEPLGAAIPRFLIEERSALRDVLTFLWTWPQFATEKLPHRKAPKS